MAENNYSAYAVHVMPGLRRTKESVYATRRCYAWLPCEGKKIPKYYLFLIEHLYSGDLSVNACQFTTKCKGDKAPKLYKTANITLPELRQYVKHALISQVLWKVRSIIAINWMQILADAGVSKRSSCC